MPTGRAFRGSGVVAWSILMILWSVTAPTVVFSDRVLAIKLTGVAGLVVANAVIAIRVLGGNRGVWGFLWRGLGLLVLTRLCALIIGALVAPLTGTYNWPVVVIASGVLSWLIVWAFFKYWPHKLYSLRPMKER
jgi:hypothetical protein